MPRFVAGDPAAVARDRGELPIERRRRLQTDEGFLRSDRIQKLFVEPFRLVFEKPRFNVDSCLPKLRESASIDDIVWIGRSDHDALDARLDDRVRARSGAAVVHARLERNVHRRVARIIALEERLDLRMRLTRTLMPPLGNDLAVADNDASNHRIRADRVAAALRELERAAHEAFVVHAGIVWCQVCSWLFSRRRRGCGYS